MDGLAVQLTYWPSGKSSLWNSRSRTVHLRPMNGAVEFALQGTRSSDALQLIDALLEPFDSKLAGQVNHLKSSRAVLLTLPAREELLFHLYRRLFGDRISSSLRCEACEKPFDLEFSVPRLLEAFQSPARLTESDAKIGSGMEGMGVFHTPFGAFRLPTGEDEPLLDGPDPELALVQCCRIETSEPGEVHAGTRRVSRKKKVDTEKNPSHISQLAHAIQEQCPILDIQLSNQCPECGHVHEKPFSMQHYLLHRLCQERPLLLQEIHHLASLYGWSLESILALTRQDRRSLAQLAVAEKNREVAW